MHKKTGRCPAKSSNSVGRRTVLMTALNVAAVALAGSMGGGESAYAVALSKSERDKLTPDQMEEDGEVKIVGAMYYLNGGVVEFLV